MARGAAPSGADTAAAKIALAERREKAVRLAVQGWSYERIRAEGGLGYGTRQAVYRDVKAALKEKIEEQGRAAAELRAKELMLIDDALNKAYEIMHTVHLAHGNGKVVRREVELQDGSTEWVEVIDQGPNLAAAERLIRFSESRRKLLGLDAPAKSEIEASGTISYVINAEPGELDAL